MTAMMRRGVLVLTAVVLAAAAGCETDRPAGNGSSEETADHTVVHELWDGRISEADIQHAKEVLHIGYGHTSHGSQITDGMSGLVAFANGGNLGASYSQDLFAWNATGEGGALHLREGSSYGEGWLELDAGYYPSWTEETREFLDDPEHGEYNVIMWSWCGQVSRMSEQDLIDHYLAPMAAFEVEYPEVTFVYMTGHLDGTGEGGNLHERNEQIREFCAERGGWLFDFADIESWDPDGTYYLDRSADDGCNYDGDGDGSREANWAREWQEAHTQGAEWYSCGSAHSEALNANMKAYAVWWLFCRIAEEL